MDLSTLDLLFSLNIHRYKKIGDSGLVGEGIVMNWMIPGSSLVKRSAGIFRPNIVMRLPVIFRSNIDNLQ